MLNYNKIIRENSHQKTRSKSIYGGNKSHTTSMNLKVSPDLMADFSNLPLKNIMFRNQERKLQEKYKLTKQNLKTDHKQMKQMKQSEKTRSNKKLKTIQQMTPQQIKLTSRASFMQKPSPSLVHKKSIIALETDRYSREKSWKKEENFEKYDRSMTKNQNPIRLKTYYLMNQDEQNYDQVQMNNMYNQIFHQPYLHGQQQHPMNKSKAINLFNAKRQENYYQAGLFGNLHENSDTIEISLSELKELMNKVNKIKDERQQLRKELAFYKNISKKDNISNSVLKALR